MIQRVKVTITGSMYIYTCHGKLDGKEVIAGMYENSACNRETLVR